MDDMTRAARSGYEGGSSPHMLTSPLDMAWRAGGWCYHNLMGAPAKASMSRGYKVRVLTQHGVTLLLDFADDSRAPTRKAA